MSGGRMMSVGPGTRGAVLKVLALILVATAGGFGVWLLLKPATSPKVAPAGTDVRPTANQSASQAWLRLPWGSESLDEGLRLLRDPSQPLTMRLIVLDRLRSKVKGMDEASLRRLYADLAGAERDASQDPQLGARLIGTTASLACLMKEKGLLQAADLAEEFAFLKTAAKDDKKLPAMRGEAIKALGILKDGDAAPLIRDLLAAPENLNKPEIARNGCLSLMRIEGEKAVQPISNVLATTSNEAVFGTAAVSLGQIKTEESMATLVKNRDRFPDSGSCGAVLVEMEGVTIKVLEEPDNSNLIPAIHATRYLYRDGQRERYVSRLRDLLTTAPVSARLAAVERLMEVARMQRLDAEKLELVPVLKAITDQPELVGYAAKIRERLAARRLEPLSGAKHP